MRAVDRELALLEQSNAALFAALAQTRTMPMNPLPATLNGKAHSEQLARRQQGAATADSSRVPGLLDIEQNDERRALKPRWCIGMRR